MISHFLAAAATFSWWIENSIASLLLFGEYEYPNPDDYK